MDNTFVSGIPMKALSLLTGDSVSAVCECQDAVSGPYRPSKGRKSQALPHPGPRAFWPLRSSQKANITLMTKNYTNIKRSLTHRESTESLGDLSQRRWVNIQTLILFELMHFKELFKACAKPGERFMCVWRYCLRQIFVGRQVRLVCNQMYLALRCR